MKRIFHLCPRCGAPDISLRVVHKQWQEMCPRCNFIANYVKFTCGDCNPDAFATCPHGDGGTPTGTLCFAGSEGAELGGEGASEEEEGAQE
jgi:ribosomal protein S27AE